MSSLWLITSYFNPLGWRSRRENYDIFRRHLDARLLTVSWSPDGNHELEEGDADILIRVDGGDLMWQKERLINIGLTHLPDDCDLVGWVDCDILFRDPLWQQQATELLRDHEVIQLYGAVEYLKAGSPIDAGFRSSVRRPSMLQAWKSAEDPDRFLREDLTLREALTTVGPYSPMSIDSSPGFAWAARRSWLESLGGLPDRTIIGSGDLHVAYALLGCWEPFAAFMQRRGLSRYFSAELWRWAERARSTLARAGCLSGEILHLHHGELVHRSYLKRQFALLSTGFLPDEHLELDKSGVWRFNALTPLETRELMANYFASRREDGPEAAQ